MKYYRHLSFALRDLLLCLPLFNPYRLCRKRGDVYGETPFETLHKIADLCDLTEEDVWLDLGCGRGRGCFWMAHFVGCRVIGVERVGLLLFLARLLKPSKLSFKIGSLLDLDYSEVTLVYLYGTTWPDALLEKIAAKVPIGARVVSISAPLVDLPILKSFPVSFPWGETTAYLQRKT